MAARYRRSDNQRYKMLLETLPNIGLAIIFGIFLLIILASASFSFFTNDAYSSKSFAASGSSDITSILKGETQVEGFVSEMKRLNTELLFWMKMSPSQTVSELTGFKHDLLLNITVLGSTKLYSSDQQSISDEGKFVELTKNTTWENRRVLTCYQGKDMCEPIVLFNEPFVRYKTYWIRIRFLNLKEQADRNVFDSNILFGVNYVDEEYARADIVYRYVFLVISVISALLFFGIVRFRQRFEVWHTEQKWIAVALFLLILYNNPLYAVQFYTGSFFLPLVNIFFRVSFLCLMMLAMLVFTHSMHTRQERRDLVTFFLPKFIVVGSLWAIGSVTYISAEFNKINDPTYSIQNDNPYYRYVVVALFMSLAAYVIMLWYHISKSVVQMMALPTKYSSKFKIVWGMTLAILCSTIILFFVVYAFNKMNQSLFLITFQVLFNVYPLLLAILFLPSSHRETISEFQDTDTTSFDMQEEVFTLGNESD